jgi:O-antigen ligase
MPSPRPTTSLAQEKTRPVERLTQVAFVLALALAIARVSFSDLSRAGAEPLGSEAPRGAGPATSMALDLLCCVPAILILARRVSDRQYVLRAAWSVLPLGLLALLGIASVLWAADKFGALVMAFHFLAAAALLWAMAQLVRSWLRLRLVAALCAGLLLAYFGHSLIYKTIDLPDLKRNWEKDRRKILEERGLAEDPFLAKQFENKVLAGELMGFFVSPNSMAAVIVLLLLVSTGVALQRLLDEPKDASSYALLLLWPLGGWMIWQTRSRTAVITPILGVGVIALAWFYRELLARHAKRLFWAGLGLVVVLSVLIVLHGHYHNSLFIETLTFRWNYWVGSAHIIRDHPLLGVGLENFGLYYLAARLPHAAEEIKDPHNVLVRFAVELGIIGAMLCVTWLLWLAWQLTRPISPPAPLAVAAAEPARVNQYNGLKTIALIAALGMLINGIASLDLTADSVYVFNEILRRANMLALLLIGAMLAGVRSLKEPALDARPAPLLLYAMLAGLAMFLLHNMIDFSILEPGPLTLFAVLAGSALGVRQPSVAGQRRRTISAAVALGAGVIAWLVLAVFIYAPTAIAEDAAHDANTAMRHRRPDQAVKLYVRAREHQPLNADYALRAAQATLATGQSAEEQFLGLIDSAIHTNKRDPSYYLSRARYLLQLPNRDARRDQIIADFAKALELNPNEVSLRVEFADALRQLGRPDDALKQYEAALRYNGLLKENEPKRLRGDRLAEVQKRIAELRGGK